MKVRILTGKFGMGHMTVALAIAEQIKAGSLDADVKVIDWFTYISPKIAGQYYHIFELLVNKGTGFYNTRYRLLENWKTDQKPELCSLFMQFMKKFIRNEQPDIIISTLPLCSQIISLYKEKTGSTIPLITCVTDITGHSEWINKNTDAYMVGDEIVRDKFMVKGVAADRIFETGIPVRLGFINKENEVKDSKISTKRILIMGGGLGMLPADESFYRRLENLPNVEITIITGKNKHMFQELSNKFKKINILGYIGNVYDYMERADILITKPGGSTVFEAIHAEIPILVLKPHLQQEKYNAEYIQEMNIGKVIDINKKECLEEIKEILRQDNLQVYKRNILEIKNRLKYNHFTLGQLIIRTAVTSGRMDKSIFDTVNYEISEECQIHEKISFNL